MTTNDDHLSGLSSDERREFWPVGLSYAEVSLAGVIGHRQVTHAYPAELARSRASRFATFDRGLAHMHIDVDLVLVS